MQNGGNAEHEVSEIHVAQKPVKYYGMNFSGDRTCKMKQDHGLCLVPLPPASGYITKVGHEPKPKPAFGFRNGKGSKKTAPEKPGGRVTTSSDTVAAVTEWPEAARILLEAASERCTRYAEWPSA